MTDYYKDIISQCKEIVKKKKHREDEESSNDLKEKSWTKAIAKRKEVREGNILTPTAKLYNEIRSLDRRFADDDFRERFPSEKSKETKPETARWFKAFLKSALETYSRCKSMADDVG